MFNKKRKATNNDFQFQRNDYASHDIICNNIDNTNI